MSSRQPPSKRKKKPPKSLLVRLSESCTSHRNNCHHDNDDQEMLNESGEPSNQCSSDMKSLKKIIPMIESACRCQHGDTCSQSDGIKKTKEKVDPKEIMHLCFFYISVVECAYCPHAMNLLFDSGRDGVEILPRVHQLFRHLASETMVQDTIKTLRRRKSNIAGKDDSKQIPSVSDQISRTCAALLYSIPEQTLQVDIVHDLIQLLQDLATIASIGVLADPTVNGEDIEVLLFSGIRRGESNSTEREEIVEYRVELGTVDRLLMLQSGIFQLFIQLFVLQHCQQLDPEVEVGTHAHLYTLPRYGFQFDGEHRSMLLKCIRQILETSSNADSKSTSILSMRSKDMACGLLFLLIPECRAHADFRGVERWQLMDLITSAVRVHFHYLGTHGEEDSSSDKGLKRLVDLVSSQYLTLLRNIFLYPSLSCESGMWELRSEYVQRLFDCIPNIIKAQRSTLDVDGLSRMVLCVIQSALCPNVESSPVVIKDLRRMVVSVFNHCKVNSLCHSVATLLSRPSYMTIMTSIITQLCHHCSHEFLDRACEMALDGKTVGNKRRRLGEDSTSDGSTTETSRTEMDNVTDSSSFTPVFVVYFLSALNEAQAVASCIAERDGDSIGEDFSTILRRNEIPVIFDAIFVLESLVFREQNKAVSTGRPIFNTLERLYEAALLATRALVAWCKGGCNDVNIHDAQDRITAIVSAMSRIFYNHLTGKFMPDNMFRVREELLVSIVDAVTSHWLHCCPSTTHTNEKDMDKENEDRSLLRKIEDCLVCIPTDHVQEINQYLSASDFQCARYCLELNNALGLSPGGARCKCDCSCQLVAQASTELNMNKEGIMESSILMLLEELLTVQQWTTLTVNMFACTLGGKAHLLDTITQSHDISDDTKMLFLTTLPSSLVPFALPPFNSDLQYCNALVQEGEESLVTLKTFCGHLLRPKLNDDGRKSIHITRTILRCLSRIVMRHAKIRCERNDTIQAASEIDQNAHLSRPKISQILLRFLEGPMSAYETIISESSTLQIDASFSLQVVDIVQELVLSHRMLRDTRMRKDLWEFILIFFMFSPSNCLTRLASVCIRSDDDDTEHEISNITINANSEHQQNSSKNKINPPATVLGWLLSTPFADEDEELRTICARQLGSNALGDNFKLPKVLLNSEANGEIDSMQCTFDELIATLFDEIDDKLHTYCGVTQSELSLSLKTTQSIGTYTSHNSVDAEALSVTCSRQISAIHFISELCQHAKGIKQGKSLVLEKGIMRLVRLWITASSYPHDETHTCNGKSYSHVALAAFRELLVLRNTEAFSYKSIVSYDETLIPGLISEILSRCFFAQKLSLNGEDQNSEYSLLIQFISSFLVPSLADQSSNITIDNQDEIYGVLTSFDKALPATIAGLVLEQDYDSICACTKFRLYLLSELKRLERKFRAGHNIEERIVGEVPNKKRQSSRRPSGEDLKRQTAKLCIMNDSNFNILGPILKSLLLDSDKASLVFFLKTVVRSEVSFGQLLKISEFTILDALLWELGMSENELSEKDCTEGSWKIIYKDHNAYHALRRAALFLQRGEDQRKIDNEHSNTPTFSLDAQEFDDSSSVKTEELVEQWMQKYFMRLLVNVTTKWKRGRIDAKISSMKSLRVLLRFLRPEDAEQYVTAIFGIIDGCMNLEPSALDDSFSRLRALAVRNLSHFTRILLSHDIKIVGENLCNIIVSLFPLFERLKNDTTAHRDNPILYGALEDGVEIFQLLADGKTGKLLAPYFSNVPFLPKDPTLQHVRDTLKKNGVNFDNLLLLSTQLSYEQRGRDSINSSSSANTEEEDVYATQRNRLQMALRKRLHSMETFLNHENDNVRRVCLMHIVDLVRNHRDLFHSVVQVEDASLRFLTVKSDQKPKHDGSSGMDSFIKGLLQRCVLETNAELRLLVSISLGEIGAISPTYIDRDANFDADNRNDGKRWIIEKGAPWKSNSVRIHYELQLVTNHFVTALKAAPTPTDQHKIAFAIQEVLKQLDIDASDSSPDSDSIVDASGKQQMNPWLRGQLEQASVYNIIEPYWTSLYKQNEASKTKSPPFFETSTSCYLWLAEWGRFMVERSNLNKRSCYSKLFFACRSAIRSEAGLGVLEFILPLLVLDSLCFGDDFDRSSTVHELKSVLIMLKESKMEKLELQKSVDIVFTVLQILQCWAENEIEERYKAPRSTGQQATIKSSKSMLSTVWPPDESLSVIEDLLNFIPFDICAEAAAYVGMHAQSLRFLEMHSRKVEAGSLLDSTCHEEEDSQKNNETLDCNKGLLRPTHVVSMDIGLAHRLSGLLDDRDTMTAISRCRKDLDVFDQLHERQSYNDWDGVLRACELAYQINPTQRGHGRFDLETFQTKALLELGHFDSALNQVAGIVNDGRAEGNKSKRLDNDLMAHAINASWRLGRWESLGRLVNILDMKCNDTLSTTLEPDRQYDFKLGKAILGLYQKDHTMVSRSLQEARESIIPSLSVVAGEDYPRAYPYLMKLQCLREVEAVFISERDSVLSVNNQRIQSSSYRDLSTSMDTIAVRLALSRISAEAEVEASLWLSAGRKARKEGLFHLAENSLSHADALYQRLRLSKDTGDPSKLSLSTESNANEVRLQIAKMKHDRGQSAEALRMIEVGEFERILHSHNRKQDLAKLLVDLEKEDQIAPFTRNALQATEWMIESGLQSGSEAIERYKLLNMISPSWERAHFRYAKYLDSVLESRISVVAARTNGGSADDESARAKIIKKEISCHKYIFEAIKEYGEASRLSQKHVFQALPRLLTLWFDFTAIEGDEDLGAIQEDVNQFMVTCIKSIPPVAYYSVLPQLISRIGHQDEDTATIVGAILKRQLVKFPAQAMWHLSWLRQSVHEDRRQKGEEMFKVAQKSLRKNEDLKNHDLLESSRDLVMFFINLAKYIPKRNDQRSFNVKHNVCKGKAELQDFLPPVQAALTVSRSAVNSSNSRDVFPRQVPRMRAFSSTVQVMSSKAKPKKLTAFAIPEGLKTSEVSNRNSNKPQSCDIGEMHFLVKREAKGDLRKDARVQDLNTVINRLFSNSTSHQAKGVKQHRRLKLRTFSVVCLSEECGILEWVPNTDSLRNVVTGSYNPHASHHSAQRRGKRFTNFVDMNLRNNYTSCQEQYFKHGNLTKAAKMFDEVMLKDYPPLFYWWFVRRFEDPHKWFEARTRFALSAAAWAAVGHVIGLGDRHSENILLDTSCGECVHVDFDCIFDKGLTLPKPEVIPFRLTPNMLDAFGPTGADGVFSGGLMSAMTTLRDNRDILLSVLEPFLRDPVIDWKRQRIQEKSGTAENNNKNVAPASIEAKRSIRVIDERLRGIYNLKNPNHKKIRRIDRETQDDDDEMASLMPLSVEGQVHKMIAEATSHENLVQVYVGWMPWL